MKFFSKIKKIIAASAAGLMALTAAATPVWADLPVTGTVNITNSREGENFDLYKIFDVTYSKTAQGKENFAYTVNENFKDYFNGKHVSINGTDTTMSKEDPKFDMQAYQFVSQLGQGDNQAAAQDGHATGVTNDQGLELKAFATDIARYIDTNHVAPAKSVTGQAGTTSITDLPYGYYIMIPEAEEMAAVFSIDTTAPTANIVNKSTYPTLEKWITGENQDSTEITGKATWNTSDKEVRADQASVGDNISYVLKSFVPNTSGYDKFYFTFTDTLSAGLTFNNNVEVYIGGRQLTNDQFTVETSKVSGTGVPAHDEDMLIRITLKDFVNLSKQFNVYDEVIVRYTARLDEDAVIGENGNPNNVDLTYSNNPELTPGNGTPENPDRPSESEKNAVGTTPKQYVLTYTSGLKAYKVNEDGERITGAQFKVEGEKINKVKYVEEVFVRQSNGTYFKLKDGTYTNVDPASANADANAYESRTEKYAKTTKTSWNTTTERVSATAFVDENGIVTFEGLGEGEYVITELKAPMGYNLLASPITVNISATLPEDDAVQEAAADIKCTWSGTVSQESGWAGALATTDATVEAGILSFNVVNTTSPELPSTGGMGRIAIYVGAAALAGFAVYNLFLKKKRAA